MPWLKCISDLTTSNIEEWVEQEGEFSFDSPQHGGTKMIFFLFLFALCTMEVVMLKIITHEMYIERASARPAGSSWFNIDEDR